MSLNPHPFVPIDPLKEHLLNYLTQSLWVNPDPHLSLPRVLQRIVTQYGPKESLIEKRDGHYHSMTFQEVSEKIQYLAAALISLGFQPGGKTAFLLKNSPAWVLGDFGTMSAGGITVPIYPTLAPHAIEYILKDSGAEIIFLENALQYKKLLEIVNHLPQIKHIIISKPAGIEFNERVMSLDNLLERGLKLYDDKKEEIQKRLNGLKRDDIASIVYTSGTTGLPKGVMLTHVNFISTVYGTISVTDYNSYDRFLSILPLSHVFERSVGYYSSLFCGSSIAYAEGIETISRNFMEFQPTMCAAVPRIFEKIYTKMLAEIGKAGFLRRSLFNWAQSVGKEVWDLWLHNLRTQDARRDNRLHHRVEDQPDQSFRWSKHPLLCSKFWLAKHLVFNKIRNRFGGKIRYFITGGAALSPTIITFFRNLQIIIYEGYGLTETSPIISFNYGNSFKENTAGKLIPHVTVKLSHEGEILVKGPNVMAGYLNQPEATRDVIDSDGWFHTGDVGEWDEENFLRITDRIKELIILSTGKNVAPLPVEQKLDQSPLISHAAVLGNNKKYISALIFPDITELQARAKIAGLTPNGLDLLIQEATVRSWFQKLIDETNRACSSFEQIKRFEIAPIDISGDNELLTPTLKLKRKMVEKKFPALIDRLYPQK